MRSLWFMAVLFFSTALLAQQETVVTGTLVGSEKKPMVMAHVHLLKGPNPKPLARVQTSSDGSFELKTKERGVLVLEFTGVNHMALDVPLIIDKPAKVELSVSLATYSYEDEPREVKIMSDLDDFSFDEARRMQKRGDGTYAIELETKKDKFIYQIFGAEKNSRSINGTQSETYEFDDAGDYRSIVTPKDGKVRIVFDLKKAVRSNAEAEVKFADPTTIIAKIANIQMEMTKRASIWSNAARAYVAAGNDWKTFAYDWSADQASIVSCLKVEKDPLVRQALLLNYVDTKFRSAAKADPQLGAQALKEIPPDSKLWMMPTLPLMMAAADLSGNRAAYGKYLGQFLEKNPDRDLKISLLENQLMSAKIQNDHTQLKLHYDMAMKYFGDTPFGKVVKERFSPTITIAVGKKAPAFRVKALEDTTKIYTNETFKRKVFLLDFWATWCGPCVGEMGNLHKAYEKYKSKNFEILSLSLDQKVEDVMKFRGDRWKMPWLHTFVTNNIKLRNMFEVVAIPRPILVDGSGKIIALEGELRGEQLEKTLAKFLGEAR